MRHILASLLLALLVPGLSSAIDVNNPPKGRFSDEWYAVMMQGSKSGHMHNTMERTQRDGKDIVRTRTEMAMVAGRGDIQISVTMTQTTEETIDGKPLRFTSKQSMAKIPTSTEGVFRDGKVTIVEKQFGFPTGSKTYQLPEGAVMSWGLYRAQMEQGLEPGSKFKLSLYEPTLAPDRLIEAAVEVFDKEEVDLFGRKVQAIRTRQTMSLPGMGGMDIATVVWVTPEGEALKLRMTFMGIDIDLISCAKSVAMSKNDPADIMTQTLIRADKPVDPEARRLTFRLEWEQDGPALPETDMQRIVRREANSITITNTRHSARPGRGAGKPLTAQERELYLEATSLLNHKDAEVAKLARRAAGDEKDPHKLADKLRSFVTKYVKTKNLNVGFATAGEVARSREGDCSEHGVLLAALGRAVGIPTRIATGYVHADEFLGEENIFVGHLWTQFYIDGQWVDVDAALHQTDVDPSHIVFALSDGGSGGVADLIGTVWMAAKPKIHVIEEITAEAE